MHSAAEKYLAQGWTAPIPLPKGDKYPPPSGSTGRIPALTRKDIERIWEGATEDCNLAVRAQIDHPEGYAVIGIDIDHYESKRGRDFLAQLEEEIGSLNLAEVPRSTRRGVNSQSAQYFFLVKEGIQWKSSACSDVDIVQLTHRYSAVWPSKAGGTEYKWYLGKNEIDVPHVTQLPVLPEAWVRHLKKSNLDTTPVSRKKLSANKSGALRAAISFLRENIHHFDLGEDQKLSAPMIQVSKSDEYRAALTGNAHDTMVAAIHKSVMLAVEGHSGLKAALLSIKDLFIDEVTTRPQASFRSKTQATSEYNSALVSEVEKLAGDIEAGNIVLIDFSEDLSLPNFADLLVPSEEAEKRPEGVEWRNYGDTDRGHSRMFYDYWGKDVLATRSEDLQEFASWTPKTGRYVFRGVKEMFDFIEYSISLPLEYEAKQIEKDIETIEKQAETGQLRPEVSDPEELKALVSYLRKRANKMRQTSSARQVLAQLHSVPEISVSISDFDSVPGIIGGTNSRTLDLKTITMFDKDEDPTRPSKRSDMLTMSTAVSIQHGATHPKWQEFLDNFLPDPEIQRFAQKVIGYSLMDNNPSKLVIFLWGPSNTGKTTILEAVSSALGDYAGPMNAQKLLGRSTGGPNPEIINSMNKRFVYLSEVGDGHELSANTIKQISGNDKQQARLNHSNEMIDAVPMFTPYISTNNPPTISQADEALRNRILVLPFNEVHPPQRITADNDIKNNKAISSAILWWVIEGARMYIEEGLLRKDWPKKVKQVSDDFLSGVSMFQTFRTLFVAEDPEASVPFESIYKAYKTWCLKDGMQERDIPSERELRKTFKNNGFTISRTTHKGQKNVYMAKGFKLEQ